MTGISIFRPDMAQIIAIGADVEMIQAGGSAVDPYAAYLVYDTFIDANGTALASHTPEKGGPWVVNAGTFTVESNRAQSSTAASVQIATIDTGQSNVIVSAIIRLIAGTSAAGIAVRLTDTSNYWLINVNDNANLFAIQEFVGGVSTTRASVAFSPSTGVDYAVVVTANGTSISATLDGANNINYASATFNQTAVKHGLRFFQNHNSDNFTIEAA